jgi:hypothetical protein
VSRRCRICRCQLSPDNATPCCCECRLRARNGDFEEEVWLPVIGFPGWEISDQGRLRDARSHAIREPDRSHRYPRVSLNGRKRYVHQLMAETWLGPRPFGRQVLHADDDPEHCALPNLAYGSHAENAADRERNRQAGRGYTATNR